MPDIKLRDGSGVEQVYTGVDTITVPLADGSGTWTYGITDEELNLSDGLPHKYFFAKGSPIYRKEFYKDNYIIKRANLSYINENNRKEGYPGEGLFKENEYIEDLSEFTIGGTGQFSDIFYNCINLKKLPNFNFSKGSIYGNQTSSTFVDCYALEQTEMDKVYSFISSFATNSQSSQMGYNYKITEFDWSKINYEDMNSSYFDPVRVDISGSMMNLRTLILPKMATVNEITSSSYGCSSSRYYNLPMLKTYKFAVQDDGTPYISKMKNQKFCTYGYSSSYRNGYGFPSHGDSDGIKSYKYTGIDVNHCITYGIQNNDLEAAKIRYNELKQYDDWHCTTGGVVTYNGSRVYLGLLFSRYNHDSMVDTINSLPDTSAYLAEKGGTNTIEFAKYQGDLTDGGGTSNLTEEEIAVATAKGWTVSIKIV